MFRAILHLYCYFVSILSIVSVAVTRAIFIRRKQVIRKSAMKRGFFVLSLTVHAVAIILTLVILFAVGHVTALVKGCQGIPLDVFPYELSRLVVCAFIVSWLVICTSYLVLGITLHTHTPLHSYIIKGHMDTCCP
jgi:heme/copper-type cytochrome/quinol oxidase subunit 1